MKHYLSLFFFLGFAVSNLFAQSGIDGRVKDRNGNPIVNAAVSLLNTRYKVLTDSAGHFEIRGISNGSYSIHARAIGYVPLNKTVNVGSALANIELLMDVEGESLEEVVVNAERTEISSQRLPLSLSAISGRKVEEHRIWTITDLTALSANLNTSHPGDNRNVTSVRGIVNTSYDQAVALFIDGVNQFSLDTYIPHLFDIERIEILKGPQGTLYGRNAMGGVINVITRDPGNRTSGFVEANIGNYGQQRYTLAFRLPLLRDKLFLGASGLFDKWDGVYTNEYNNSSYDRRKTAAGNYYLRFVPAPTWSVTFNAKHVSNRNHGPFPLVFGKEDAFAKPFLLNQNATTKMIDNGLNSSLSVRHTGAAFILNSLTAYQTNYRYYTDPIDADFSQMDAISIANNFGEEWNKVKVVTQEFNIGSPAASESLKWLAGVFMFNRENPVKQATLFGDDAQMIGAPDKNFSLINSSKGRDKGVAVYGQLSYSIHETFRMIAGLRYDHEKREQQILGEYQKDPDPNTMFAYRSDTSATASFSSFSPKFTLSFEPTAKESFYASYSRGFRGGGLTPISSDPSQPALYPFQSEKSNNIEVGSKGNYWNEKLIFNLALFYALVSDVQVPTLVLPDAVTITRNTGELKTKGVEAEIRSIPVKGLLLDYSFGYTDARYEKLKLAQNGEEKDLRDNKQVFTPNITSMLASQYSIPLGRGEKVSIVVRGEWKYLGKQYFDLANEISQSSYHVLNTRFGVASKNSEIMFWGRNITDTRYISYAYDFGAVHSGDPATYGITAKVKF